MDDQQAAPFPKLPGEALRLGQFSPSLREFLPIDAVALERIHGERDSPPALMMMILEIMAKRPQLASPPPEFTALLNQDASAQRELEDWAGLARMRREADAWFEGPRVVHRSEAEARIFNEVVAAIRADLGEWGEAPKAALTRIKREWPAYRAGLTALARAAEVSQRERFMARARWPFLSAVSWLAFEDELRAIEAPQTAREIGLGEAAHNWVLMNADGDPIRPDAWEMLLDACATGAVSLFGVVDQNEVIVPAHVIETWRDHGGFGFVDEDAQAAAHAGRRWLGINIDASAVKLLAGKLKEPSARSVSVPQEKGEKEVLVADSGPSDDLTPAHRAVRAAAEAVFPSGRPAGMRNKRMYDEIRAKLPHGVRAEDSTMNKALSNTIWAAHPWKPRKAKLAKVSRDTVG